MKENKQTTPKKLSEQSETECIEDVLEYQAAAEEDPIQETNFYDSIKVKVTHQEMVKDEGRALAAIGSDNKGKICLLKKIATCKCNFKTSTSLECGKTVNLYTNLKTTLPVIEYQGKIVGPGWEDIIAMCINFLRDKEGLDSNTSCQSEVQDETE